MDDILQSSILFKKPLYVPRSIESKRGQWKD